MMRTRALLRDGCCCAAIAFGIIAPAKAQEQPAGAPTPQEAIAPATDSADIVVTAQKRSESAQRVPISITAVSAATLRDTNVTSLTGLQRIAPGLTIARLSNATSQRLTIRGVGSSTSGALEPSVATFLDGIYVPRPPSITGDLLDVQTIEVLRGPQGTLFGRNASMGAISIRSADPGREYGMSASLRLGSYDQVRAEAAVDLPASDALRFRIAGSADHYGGDFHALYPQRHRLGVVNSDQIRGTLLWQPDNRLTVRFRADYHNTYGDGQALSEVVPSTVPANNSYQARLDPDGAGPIVVPALADGRPFDRNSPSYQYGRLDDRVWSARGDVTYDLAGGFAIKAIAGYVDWYSRPSETDTAFTALPLISRTQVFKSQAQSYELQLVSPERQLLDGRLDFVAGVYGYKEDYGIATRIGLSTDYCNGLIRNVLPARYAACLAQPRDVAGTDDFTQQTRSLAAYGQATLHLTDTLSATGGTRWTRDAKDGVFAQRRFNAAEILHSDETTPLAITNRKVTWRGGLQWQVLPRVMLYGFYSTGFKSGGFNNTQSTTALGQARVFQPETVSNWEGGVKSSFLDGAVLANVNLFRSTLDDYQSRGFNGIAYTIRNVGSLRQQGVEGEFRVRLVRPVTLGVAGTYLDSEFLDFRNAPNLPAFTGTQDLTGKRSTFSPKWQGNAYAQYDGAIGGRGLTWLARFDIQFRSSANIGSDDNADPDTVQRAYSVMGARVALNGPDERWQIALYGANLADTDYCTYKLPQTAESLLGVRNPATGGTAIRCYVGAPRTAGAQFSVKF